MSTTRKVSMRAAREKLEAHFGYPIDVPEPWTEVKRVVPVNGELVVKQTTCCCAAPGVVKRRECAEAAGNKTPCRCYCHSTKL